jgi:hemerythrin superfamily protein
MQSDITDVPVRGNDAIEILINDHQTIKDLLTRLTGTTQPAALTQTLEQLKGVLTIHNATEENLVYPALSKVAHKNSESLKLYNETAEADMLLFEVDTMLKEGKTDGIEKKTKKLQAAILEHIEDEEQKAFKHLQEKSEPQQSQMLTQSVREFRNRFRLQGAARSETGEIGRR